MPVDQTNRREFIAGLSSAAAWPVVVARAQQPAMPIIGSMSARSPEDTVEVFKAFHNGLAQGGFIDGQNVNIEYRWARGDYSRLPVLATELIGLHIDVLVATGGDRAARAAKEATATIPVVFNMGGDPVKAGVVKSIDQPAGNVTGSVLLADTLEPKRLDLMHEIVPDVSLFGALVNPTYPAAADQLRDLEAAVPKFGRRLLVVTASNEDELTNAFATIERAGVGALLVTSDPFFDTFRRRIIEFAAQSKLPAIYQFPEYAYEGGLVSYGPSITDAYRQVGLYTARILKGERPGELPVLRPTKFDFVLNLKTAATLGLTVPPTLLARADEVIQ